MELLRPSHFAISRAIISVIIVVILVVAGGAAYLLYSNGGKGTSSTSPGGTTTTSSSSTSSTTTSTTHSVASPQSITYETIQTIQFLDPLVSYDIFGASVEQNIYEPLIWFNGTNGVDPVPWLAQSFHLSSDGLTMDFTLRNGIKFADGETLNSSDVWFSYNRLLIMDGSAPVGHGTQASWIVQQLLNTSLSTTLCGCSQTYGPSYTRAVLAEHFVEMTGPLTLRLHIMHPQGATPYLLSNLWANILAPDWVMQHDIQTWSAPGLGYHLPHTTLSGNLTQRMTQYFDDFQATCDAKGCAATYLDSSSQGSLAGTGPYTIQSVDTASNVIVMKANPNYWGGPGNKIQAHIPTVTIKYVPDQTTREIDLQNAAKSPGQAMVIDVATTNIYDVANRQSWLNNHQLVSTISGVKINGPFTQYASYFIPLNTNVTNPFTGTFYQFQPFADLRMRLAFADSVNLTTVNSQYNNNLGQVANEVVPPGIPPAGAWSSSVTVPYSFNPHKVQQLLLDAMQNPITKFNLVNGTAAPAGMFNNAFGCAHLNAGGKCDSPTGQTVSLVYATGDTVDEQILNQIAGTINNVSSTYNMGLTVAVTPVPCGQMVSQAFSGQVYAWAESCFGWFDDYPWSMDFLGPILAPGGIYTAPGGWNLKAMGTLWTQAQAANAAGNSAGVVSATNAMVNLGNQQVMDICTFYPEIYMVMTSNVQGFYFNPAIYTTGEPQYFATLY
ncbi:MAG TPA: ABC transporter substrate-binding protein [Nitrososphaerales archaeon]|nr:ABC transporter substrate-binding protein [Nitrososphaerales archaeon]